MPGHRMDRLTEDIKREIIDILRDVKDPRITGLVSVVRVEVSSDLSYAKVYVSNIGGDVKETLKGLNNAAGFVRSALASRIDVRKTPRIKFIGDDSIEQSARISKMLGDLTKGE
jgi:ribosome-binding factor A